MKRFSGLMFVVISLLCANNAFAWGERKVAKRLSNDRGTTLNIYSWRNSLAGDASVKGMSADFKSDAGVSNKPAAGGAFSMPLTTNTHVTLAYNTFDNSGSLNKVVKFDNLNYKSGANLRLQNSWLDLTGAYQWTKTESGYADLLLGVKAGDSTIDITGFDTVANKAIAGSWSQKYPIPYIGVGGGFKMADNMFVDGHIKFISLNIGNGNVKSYDLDLNLAYELRPPQTKSKSMVFRAKKKEETSQWFATIGYRTFLVDGSFDKDSVKISYSGPVLGIQGRF